MGSAGCVIVAGGVYSSLGGRAIWRLAARLSHLLQDARDENG
jgi:hypothetical protein